MRLIYLTSKIYPSKTANSIQTLYMAKNFAEALGNDFLFILSKSYDPELFKGIQVRETGYVRSSFRSLYYFLYFPIFLVRHHRELVPDAVLYCRDFYLTITAIIFKKIFGYKIAFEYHDPPFGHMRDALITRFCDYLLPTTKAMRDYLIKSHHTDEGKFLIASNGVDTSKFSIDSSKEECREGLGLPINKKIVLYSGHLYPKKGAYTLLAAARSLKDILFVFVGGAEKDIETFKKSASGLGNIFIAGYKGQGEIPLWLKSADVLAAPQSAKDEAAKKWASPIKIFEYMASGVPMIVSDIPPLREILDEDIAYFAKPDDEDDFVFKISSVFEDYNDAKNRSAKARERARNYSWENRAGKILEFISK